MQSCRHGFDVQGLKTLQHGNKADITSLLSFDVGFFNMSTSGIVSSTILRHIRSVLQ